MTSLIAIYAAMILDGHWSWEQVPTSILPQVEAVYNILVGAPLATY